MSTTTPDSCAILIGRVDQGYSMAQHKNVKIHFGGEIPTLHLGALQAIKTSTPVKLFEHLRENTQPIATKPRRYSQANTEFISSEVKRLFNNDLIEPSSSLWRAHPLVVMQVNHKKRMVIDYSQIVNKFSLLDAYSLPHMQDIVTRIAQYKVYSMLNLTSAYHQVKLPSSDRLYTTFQADGSLWQWKRIPFSLINAVPCFQRIVDDIIEYNGCKGTFAYLDNITVGGATQEDHDKNLSKFLSVSKTHNLTFNEAKCVYSTDTIKLLGYEIHNGCLRRDPDRVKTLRELSPPKTTKEQQPVVGLFAYWIMHYSDKMKPLVINRVFPLKDQALS